MADKGLTAVTATTSGTWYSITNTRKLSIHVYGSTSTGFNATVQIRGSNKPTKPANSLDDVLLASATGEQLIVIDTPIKWIKHMVSSYTAGTISTATVGGFDG